MTNTDLIISSRWVLPIAPQNTILENHAVVINDGKIQAVLDTKAAIEQYKPKSHIELNSHVLMPGLVNAHAHTPMNLFRGLADDLELMDWLNNHIWPAEKALINPQSVKVGSRLAIAEMLRGGTTCFNDNYFFPNVTAEVALEEGIRASLGCVILSVPTEWAKDEDEYFTKSEQILKNTPQSDLISWTMCPHAPYTVNDKSLQKVKQLSDQLNIPIHMHLHETQTETEQSLQEYGKRPMQRLEDLGLLSDKFIAVHMTDLTEQEIGLAKSRNLHIVHCPQSNLKLASGFSPIAKLLAAGINVAVGTDGAASNNDLDMFSELSTAAMLAKAVSGDPTAVPAAKALEMATINGAKALGLDDKIGSLEAGKYADIIAVDLQHYFTQPIYNPISHLIYAVNRLQVSDVWVAGKQLLQSGSFTQLQTTDLVEQTQKWADQAKTFTAQKKTRNSTEIKDCVTSA